MSQESRVIEPGPLRTKALSPVWLDSLLGLLVGFAGGLLCNAALDSWTPHNLVLASLFGLIFGLFFSKRATSPGAGLIWGLGFAFFMWIVVPAGLGHLFSGVRHPGSMFGDAQEHFPDLVAYLVCLGMPVGLLLGIRGAFRNKGKQPAFSWGRAIIVGGFSGLLGGMIFGRWMSAGDFFPLLAGLGVVHSHEMTVALHFGIAILIGATFGVLFQRDVRGYGSSMGWGLGYGIFWWFFGPLTALPILARTASRLVRRPGHRYVRFSCRPHSLRADPRRGLCHCGSALGSAVYPIRPTQSGTRGSRFASLSVVALGSVRGFDGRTRCEPNPLCHWCSLVGSGPRHPSFRLSRFLGSLVRERGNRNDLRSSLSQRSLHFGIRSHVGMALRTHLVVHRTNDPLATAFDRRVRLESQHSFGAAAVFDWAFDFWRNHSSDLPRTRKTLHTRAVLGSSYRRSGIASNPPRGNARTCLVASHAWAGSLTAYSLGVMPIAGKWEADASHSGQARFCRVPTPSLLCLRYHNFMDDFSRSSRFGIEPGFYGCPTLRGLCEGWDGFDLLSVSKNLKRSLRSIRGSGPILAKLAPAALVFGITTYG